MKAKGRQYNLTLIGLILYDYPVSNILGTQLKKIFFTSLQLIGNLLVSSVYLFLQHLKSVLCLYKMFCLGVYLPC